MATITAIKIRNDLWIGVQFNLYTDFFNHKPIFWYASVGQGHFLLYGKIKDFST